MYATQAGRDRVGLAAFTREAAPARGTRIVGVGLALSAFGAVAHRLRRYYPHWLAAFGIGFTAGFAMVLRSWEK